MMEPAAARLPGRVGGCPVCACSEASRLAEIAFADIWAELERQYGARFSPAVRQRHTPGATTALWQCTRCGLQYFRPAVAGDREFYGALMQTVAYERRRWEFDVVLRHLRAGEQVVDFGCGEGAFLTDAISRGVRAVGVDHNDAAIDQLRAKGIEAHADEFATFSGRERGRFDVACAFQVLEHLEAPTDLMEPLIESVRPGGRIFVAVPNRDRSVRAASEPFDAPPHHMTRWSPDQFEVLAGQFGLECVSLALSPPTFEETIELHRRRLGPVLAKLPRGLSQLSWSIAWRMSAGRRRYKRRVARASFQRRGLVGHALLAELRKP
jgi:SAM-dependent methyltransferase